MSQKLKKECQFVHEMRSFKLKMQQTRTPLESLRRSLTCTC